MGPQPGQLLEQLQRLGSKRRWHGGCRLRSQRRGGPAQLAIPVGQAAVVEPVDANLAFRGAAVSGATRPQHRGQASAHAPLESGLETVE